MTLKSIIPFTAVYFLAAYLYKSLGSRYYLSTMEVALVILIVTFHIARRIRIYLTEKDDTTHGDLE